MHSLLDQIGLADPRARLSAQLAQLDTTIASARSRRREYRGECYSDPDGATVVKCLEAAAKLIAAYHAQTMSSAESIGTLDRAQACAELRAVLEAWEDPTVTDEQWRAARTNGIEAAARAPQGARATVVRRKKK